MDVLVCVVWSVALLTHTPSLKAESTASGPSLTTVSLNEAADLFVTAKATDPKEPIRMDLSRPPPAPQRISSASTDRPQGPLSPGASATSLSPMTPVMTINYANTKMTDRKEPITDTTAGADIIRASERVTSTNATEGSLDIAPSFIPPRSTTITPGSTIPSSTNLSEEHPNSSQFTTPETTPTAPLIPSSIPASTLTDFSTGSASLRKENQDGPSELDVGDEDSDIVPSPSPLDPLLAGLISIFIISTAMLSIIIFLKFRQQSSHPEFHRLQDLPMDDLLEDTPLSRYSY